MPSKLPELESGWLHALQPEFSKAYFLYIKTFLKSEKKNKKAIYPPGSLIFNAFNQTPFDKVKVIILGQDPYHGEGQAHGLSFSVPDGIKPPPSLVNIFKELQSDLQIPIPQSGNLSHWAQQGVFLLNAMLTVESNQSASHQKIGWQYFTDAAIKQLSEKKEHLVFLLWGKFAQQKKELIDANKHLILEAAHPSPFSAYNGFFGCKHFSKTNAYLAQHNLELINWQLK
ncbi:MAG: uracil-DNA glycosylase [Chitinophagales bacterium]|nr:uracil-DNA glycosylase [Chitinophagales bacterium]MBP8754805.1 uracil-DNA glycosylase [Chitinophagales bacterium]MBP9188321.1 uracil-DNA glycosylase [Chitinophagales bacterium]MBP9705819.1 uracil-DNA glycosylase [Chitinophagales bacterium]